MNYLLAPFHAHRDLGFGATGNAFKAAADQLDGSADFKKAALFGADLPTNYLYRHGIELHLKSAIVVFHRRFQLPYGEFAFDSEPPRVQVADKWKPFHEIHRIDLLWAYVRQLFATHGDWLASNTKCNWTIDPEADSWVQTVHGGDPRSTFFRYPTTSKLSEDGVKSAMKEVTADELLQMLGKSGALVMMVENENKEFVTAYVNDETADSSFRDALRNLSKFCDDLHAAMRWELCDGW